MKSESVKSEIDGKSTAVRASVCMATYRGADYVAEQLGSILAQLGPTDELVIVDDASPDDTVGVIEAMGDPRIVLHQAEENQGYVRSFEQAVLASSGQFVFLADQDDVWIPGRLNAMLEALSEADVVATNFAVLGGGDRGRVRLLRAVDSRRYVRNIIGALVGYRPYYGCGMAMSRELAMVFTPIPGFMTESHDLWLALCGNAAKSIIHLDEPTLLRRLHDSNETPTGWRSLRKILRARLALFRALAEAIRRTRRLH